MPRLRPQDVERMEGPAPSTDTVCISHNELIEACSRCGAEFFRCCIHYIMENRPGICGTCGHRDYLDELYRQYLPDEEPPQWEEDFWVDPARGDGE